MVISLFNIINCSIITPRLKVQLMENNLLITYKFALIMPL